MCGSTTFASFTKSSFSIADFGCTCRMECSVSRLYSITTPTSAAVAGPATGGGPTRPGQHDPERVAARGAQDCLACWADRAIAAAPTLEVTGR